MQHAKREIYTDADFVYETSDMTPVEAAFNCGLKGISYLGINIETPTESTGLAFLRGRSARHLQPIIDDPAAPSCFPSATALA